MRFERISLRQVQVKLRRVVIGVVADVGGGKLRAWGLHHAVDGGAVVIRRLHRPNLVALRAEGFGGIGFHTHVDDGRHAVGVNQKIPHVIVVVALAVVARLRGQVQALSGAFLHTRHHHLDAREPRIAEKGLRARRLAQRGQVEQRGQLAADGVAGNCFFILFERAEGAVRHHALVAHALAEAVHKIAIGNHARLCIAEVRVPVVINVRAADIEPHLAQPAAG